MFGYLVKPTACVKPFLAKEDFVALFVQNDEYCPLGIVIIREGRRWGGETGSGGRLGNLW